VALCLVILLFILISARGLCLGSFSSNSKWTMTRALGSIWNLFCFSNGHEYLLHRHIPPPFSAGQTAFSLLLDAHELSSGKRSNTGWEIILLYCRTVWLVFPVCLLMILLWLLFLCCWGILPYRRCSYIPDWPPTIWLCIPILFWFLSLWSKLIFMSLAR